ncbi:carbohydrate-binding module family 32 protein [Calycina marina]|uniref:Carbohydrate-binding module family 32 protein n=1 Tax=Calycina marina TaxID=1763456 RepID=A0A9P7YU67_9HELO|nr:carbohydrate-binding module family 32 protein [Calycina marina]
MLIFVNLLFLTIVHLVQGLNVTTSDANSGNPASNAGDGNATTFWHSQYSPTVVPLPHWAIVDLGADTFINGLSYLPRQDGNLNGNIGQYIIETSTNTSTWTTVTTGAFMDDNSKKYAGFSAVTARYIRITALTEAGNRGNWSSAAEFGYNAAPTSTNLGQWSPVYNQPITIAASYLLPGGNVFSFGSFKPDTFGGANGFTLSVTFNAVTGTSTQATISQTGHDMFCPGMSLDANGSAIVTGGDDASNTSINDAVTGDWIAGPLMNIPRGYQSSAALSNGQIFTIGGSWSGGRGGKNGEKYDSATNAWSLLSGALVAPMLTADAGGIFRQDNHGWLFGWKNEYVFQAGPSSAMNWYSTTGNGSQVSAGTRAAAVDSMSGIAVMYDAVAGKIFTAGGSTSYQDVDAHNETYLITIGTPPAVPTVATLTSMTYTRAFHNSVVLPNGKVFITGGQTYAVPFSDLNSIFTPELWDPVTQTFTVLPAHVVPRNYHSIALLLLDGRVYTSGGGLCGTKCGTNHPDVEIYSPSYLFTSTGELATRPVISSISATSIAVGGTLTVVTDSEISSWSLIRYGSATHTVNTDQRRAPLTPTATDGTTYTFVLPSDSGIMLPGLWMLFALNSAGVPSLAETVKVTVSEQSKVRKLELG